MKTSIALVLLGLVVLTAGKPTFFEVPTQLAYATLVPAAPVGPDGRVVDTPEVSAAKSQHAAAQQTERANLALEAARSGDLEVVAAPQTLLGRVLVAQSGGLAQILAGQDVALALGSPLALTTSAAAPEAIAAPVGADGRVVDTAAVARAKAEHAAAHLNEKLQLVNEAARNSGLVAVSTSPAAFALRL